MSTISQHSVQIDSTVTSHSSGWSMRRPASGDRMVYSTSILLGDNSGIGLSSNLRTTSQYAAKKSGHEARVLKVKRRFQGFFIQAEGQEARVAIVDKGALVHYFLPLSSLLDAGVKTENQPFELDELEAKIDGVTMTGHKIRASAPAGSSEVAPLPLNEDYQRKLNRLLRR